MLKQVLQGPLQVMCSLASMKDRRLLVAVSVRDTLVKQHVTSQAACQKKNQYMLKSALFGHGRTGMRAGKQTPKIAVAAWLLEISDTKILAAVVKVWCHSSEIIPCR